MGAVLALRPVAITTPIWLKLGFYFHSLLLVHFEVADCLATRPTSDSAPNIFTRLSHLRREVHRPHSTFIHRATQSGYRVEVEHDIGHIFVPYGVLHEEMNIETQYPAEWYQAAVFMRNIHTCVYHSNQTAIRFRCAPPRLLVYLR